MITWLHDKVYMFLLQRLNRKKYEVVKLRWKKAKLQAALDKARQRKEEKGSTD